MSKFSDGIKKIDRRLGMDQYGRLVNLELHVSTPGNPVCAYCGKSLKNEKHVVGLNFGYRYCMRDFEKSKQLKDLPDLLEEIGGKSLR